MATNESYLIHWKARTELCLISLPVHCFPMLWIGLFLWVTHREEIVQKIRILPVFTCREEYLRWLNSAPGCQQQSRHLEFSSCTCILSLMKPWNLQREDQEILVSNLCSFPGLQMTHGSFLSLHGLWHPLRACSRQGFIGLWSQPTMITRALVRLGWIVFPRGTTQSIVGQVPRLLLLSWWNYVTSQNVRFPKGRKRGQKWLSSGSPALKFSLADK